MSASQFEGGSYDLRDVLVERLEQGELTLPPLPEIGQQVLAMVSDETSSAESLAGLVQRDAGLASTLVRYSNTAALGGSVPIVSLSQAISRLGMQRVSELAFAVSMKSGIGGGNRYKALFSDYWRRSLATGLFSKEIAREMRVNVEVAFLCGLLRGVGRPLVLHALCELPSAKELPDDEGAAAIAETLAPAFLNAAATAWGLPDTVATAIVLQGGPDERSDEARICCLAERLADYALEAATATATGNEAAKAGEPGKSGEVAEPAEFGGDADADALNLYPETLEGLVALGSSICAEVEAL